MVFKDRDEAGYGFRNGYVHLHTRVGIATDSLQTLDRRAKTQGPS